MRVDGQTRAPDLLLQARRRSQPGRGEVHSLATPLAASTLRRDRCTNGVFGAVETRTPAGVAATLSEIVENLSRTAEIRFVGV